MMQACKITLKAICEETRGVEGDIAEIGVWRGESAKWILQHTLGCVIYLYDTFTGMPKEMVTAGCDFHTEHSFRDTSIDMVRNTLKTYEARVIYRPGVFPQTAKGDMGPFRFVHVDCDLYLSTKHALEWCAEKISPGGVILDDDYGCGSCAGARKAVNEWLQQHQQWTLETRGSRGILRKQPEARL